MIEEIVLCFNTGRYTHTVYLIMQTFFLDAEREQREVITSLLEQMRNQMGESSETDLLQAVLEDLVHKSIEQEMNGLIQRGGSSRVENPNYYNGVYGLLRNLEHGSNGAMATRGQTSVRDVPATPSHMRLRIEDQSSARQTNQISSTADNQSNFINHGSVASTPETNQESSTVAPGYYPALPGTFDSERATRTIPTNPAPMFTIGNYGNGLFDLMSPVGLSASHDGKNVLVSDQEKNRILIYDMESSQIQGVIKCDLEIKDLAISTMGHVVAASSKTGSPLGQAYTMEGDKIAMLGMKNSRFVLKVPPSSLDSLQFENHS